MLKKFSLGVVDYIIICLLLLISTGIGLFARYFKNEQKIATDYLLAGKNMPIYPVVFSLIVTITSPASFLAVPAEVYKYGVAFSITNFSIPIGMILISSVILPVYFQCEVSSITEVRNLNVESYVPNSLINIFA